MFGYTASYICQVDNPMYLLDIVITKNQNNQISLKKKPFNREACSERCYFMYVGKGNIAINVWKCLAI